MKTGRPKLPQSEKRSNTLRIRLNAKERRMLDKMAEASGKDTSTWARDELLGNGGRKKSDEP